MNKKTTALFADILQDLIASSGKTIKELSKEIGISEGSLSKYQNDEGEAGIEKLRKISRYFNVSCDYLLGETQVKSPQADIKTTCLTTGLSEKAVNKIININEFLIGKIDKWGDLDNQKIVEYNGKPYYGLKILKELLNELIENNFFFDFLCVSEELLGRYSRMRGFDSINFSSKAFNIRDNTENTNRENESDELEIDVEKYFEDKEAIKKHYMFETWNTQNLVMELLIDFIYSLYEKNSSRFNQIYTDKNLSARKVYIQGKIDIK